MRAFTTGGAEKGSTMAKLIIKTETSRCMGHAMCANAASDIFELDDNGYNMTEIREIETDDVDYVRRAVASCPEVIITLEEADS